MSAYIDTKWHAANDDDDGSAAVVLRPVTAALLIAGPAWQLPLTTIRSARLRRPLLGAGAYASELELHADARVLRLRLQQWIDPTRLSRAQARRLRSGRAQARWACEHDAVVPYLEAHGVPVEGRAAAPGFDLWQHPVARAAVVLFFAVGLYGLADGFFLNTETYATPPAWSIFAMLGISAALPALIVLRRVGIPALETVALSVLLGSAIGGAGYPLALRINQLTAGEWAAYEYVRTEGLRFAAREPDLPELRFAGNADYWLRFPAGTVHRFWLRRGMLGFYQIDRAPIWEDMRRYYRQPPQ